MMGQKHLHELLKEDQEPFLLNKYISDRRSQMIKRPSTPKTSLQQVKKRKLPMNHHQIPKSSNFPINLCTKNSCLFSLTETPDFRKSPLFELPSPVKSPCKSPNKIFLHVPSRTASLLLDAALRIQKTKTTKVKTKSKGFGLFGNLFKKLTQRKHEIESGNVSVKDILKMHSQNDNNIGFHCSYEERLSSGAVWSESNNMETSSSGYYCDSEKIIRFVNNHEECACCHRAFSESPFRFVLETNPCSGSHTPELASPSRHVTEEKESNEGESVKQIKSGEELEEEDKEQNSPVCVLEPPFEDDDEEGHENNDEEDDDEGDGFDLESSYAIVQRARQQILYKLCRFEKLAELDPVELEKRMLEQEEEEDDDLEDEEDRELSCKENDFKEQVYEAVFLSLVQDKQQIPQQFRKLISDLILEEGIVLESLEDREMMIKGICKRLESWKKVECNTIDMMIKEDFSKEDIVWKKNGEEKSKMACELEIAIFGFLVEEVSEELVC